MVKLIESAVESTDTSTDEEESHLVNRTENENRHSESCAGFESIQRSSGGMRRSRK